MYNAKYFLAENQMGYTNKQTTISVLQVILSPVFVRKYRLPLPYKHQAEGSLHLSLLSACYSCGYIPAAQTCC